MASPSELTNYASLAAVFGAGLWALFKWRQSERLRSGVKADRAAEAVLRDDANLRDDQREFIAVLQRENAQWRVQVDELRSVVDRLRDEIEHLRGELATERRARQASEARAAAETQTRSSFGSGNQAQERAIADAGREAEENSLRNDPPGGSGDG